MSAQTDRGGVRHMIAAAFFFSLMSLIVKTLGAGMPTAQVVFARSVVMLVLAFVMIRRAGVALWGNRKPLLVLRALSGFDALFCFFYAVPRLPLAEVTVLHFTNPVFTAILAALVLGESMGWREIAGMVTSFTGVILIARRRSCSEDSRVGSFPPPSRRRSRGRYSLLLRTRWCASSARATTTSSSFSTAVVQST